MPTVRIDGEKIGALIRSRPTAYEDVVRHVKAGRCAVSEILKEIFPELRFETFDKFPVRGAFELTPDMVAGINLYEFVFHFATDEEAVAFRMKNF